MNEKRREIERERERGEVWRGEVWRGEERREGRSSNTTHTHMRRKTESKRGICCESKIGTTMPSGPVSYHSKLYIASYLHFASDFLLLSFSGCVFGQCLNVTYMLLRYRHSSNTFCNLYLASIV